MDLLSNFLTYVKVDTQSDENSSLTPSTLKQYDLLNILKKQLDELNIPSYIDEYGRLYGYLEGNEKLDAIGLCAHVDTALETSGKDVKPQVIKDYDLSDIPLGKSGLTLSSKDFSHLLDCKGKTIITTDGTTLLGADDKAGLAIIMDVAKRLLAVDKKIRHPLAILFTPDEEIGRGPEHFSKEKYRAKYAYTMDGASPNLISYENFNAKSAEVIIKGKSIHPGEGKDKLINAILLMNEFISLLPPTMTPFHTSNREGFNHITSIKGDVEECRTSFILRNHDATLLEKQVQDFYKNKDIITKKYPGSVVSLSFKEQYKNMLEVIEKHPEVINSITETYKRMNIPYSFEATRGGTDGATFSFLGVPTPNLGTGSYNHHGRYEYAVLEEMELLSDILLNLFTH